MAVISCRRLLDAARNVLGLQAAADTRALGCCVLFAVALFPFGASAGGGSTLHAENVTLPSFHPRIDARAGTAAYSFTRQFGMTEKANQQGLAFGGGYMWVCFDTGSGMGKIIKYSLSGAVLKASPDLPLGHCAEIAYRSKDGTVYAVDYVKGSASAHVRVVDMSLARPAVVKTIDVTRYGLAGMIAVDNSRDELLVFGGSRPYRFNFLALTGSKSGTTVTWLRQVTYGPSLGLPQGLEVVGKEILFSTTNFRNGMITGNRIHVFSRAAVYKGYIKVPIDRESEGLAIDDRHRVYVGFHKPNSVYVMTPAYAGVP
jgi:hypothetical protein